MNNMQRALWDDIAVMLRATAFVRHASAHAPRHRSPDPFSPEHCRWWRGVTRRRPPAPLPGDTISRAVRRSRFATMLMRRVLLPPDAYLARYERERNRFCLDRMEGKR